MASITSFNPQVLINNVLVPASQQTLYTAPALTTVEIRAMTVNNTDTTTPHSVSIWLAPTGTAGGAASLIASFTLAAGASQQVYQALNQMLSTGMTIQALSDSPAVSMFASGLLMT